MLVVAAAAAYWYVDMRPLAYMPLEQGEAAGRALVYYLAPSGEAVPLVRTLPASAAPSSARLWSALALLVAGPPVDSGLRGPLPAGMSLRRIAYVERATTATVPRLVAELDFRRDDGAIPGQLGTKSALAAGALDVIARTVAGQSNAAALRVLVGGVPLSAGAVGEPSGLPLAAFRGPTRWRPLRCGPRTLLVPERAELAWAMDVPELTRLRDLITDDYAARLLPHGTVRASIELTDDGTIAIRLARPAWPQTPRARAQLQLACDALALTVRSVSPRPIDIASTDGAPIHEYRGPLWPNPE